MSAATEPLAQVLIRAQIDGSRSRRVASNELQKFMPDEIALFTEQLSRIPRKAGSYDPCGPEFDRYESIPLWMRGTLYFMLFTGSTILLPMQLVASMYLLVHGRMKPIWHELPAPTLHLWEWTTSMTAYVKAPLYLIERSIREKAALCVNRRGQFKLLTKGYTFMSYVWTEIMGWQSKQGFGPVDISLRKKGIHYEHFLKFFDRCNCEWLWVDLIAMPEVLEDMSSDEKENIEVLRTAIINQFRDLVRQAAKVVVLDTTLLRLGTASPIDVGICLVLGHWITRLWTLTETRLAQRVILRTRDSDFDLDEIIDHFDQILTNFEDRYFHLYARLTRLREDTSKSRVRLVSPLRLDSQEPNLLAEIFYGTENRWTGATVDEARALFPVLHLKWDHRWDAMEGFDHIAEAFPDDKDILVLYCRYHDIDWPKS
ncbi:MAG: hypothetical protein M1821_003282 [Bathelium mastoideum]|nr:MAG: hypothetical protein M1821_003282 [Bathelium mastoideum]KAI9689360.1 MAG: hypothetical protein M1822_010011 [Bathelium mastoideum]